MLDEIVERRFAAWAELHDGADVLTPARIGDTDDERVENGRMTLQHRLDLFGEDLLAARVDALVAASEHGDRPVGLEDGAIAGNRPARAVVLDEGGSRLLVV